MDTYDDGESFAAEDETDEVDVSDLLAQPVLELMDELELDERDSLRLARDILAEIYGDRLDVR